MSNSWIYEEVEPKAAEPTQAILSDANELPEDSDEEEIEEEEMSSGEDDGSYYQKAGGNELFSESEEGEEMDDEYQDAALDRRQYGILLGVAFSLYFDKAIDRQQRGLLKDLILCDDGRMVVAMDNHDWLVEHNQVDEANQFEQLMEVMYSIATGQDDEGSTDSDSSEGSSKASDEGW
jgi:hypothetical protein